MPFLLFSLSAILARDLAAISVTYRQIQTQPRSLLSFRHNGLNTQIGTRSRWRWAESTFESGPASRRATSLWRPPHSLIALENCFVLLRLPITAAALSVTAWTVLVNVVKQSEIQNMALYEFKIVISDSDLVCSLYSKQNHLHMVCTQRKRCEAICIAKRTTEKMINASSGTACLLAVCHAYRWRWVGCHDANETLHPGWNAEKSQFVPLISSCKYAQAVNCLFRQFIFWLQVDMRSFKVSWKANWSHVETTTLNDAPLWWQLASSCLKASQQHRLKIKKYLHSPV